jgi:hypothetical protein
VGGGGGTGGATVALDGALECVMPANVRAY